MKGDVRTELNIPNDSADLVTSFYTAGPWGVHEVPWKKIYAAGARALKPGGAFVITTEQDNSIRHIVSFLEEAGLSVIFTSETPNTIDRYVVVAKK